MSTQTDTEKAKQDLENAAAAVQDQLDGKPAAAPKAEETPEEEEVPEESDSETAVPDLSDVERSEAFNLYKALKDPKTSPALVAALAQQAGILGKPSVAPATVREEREAKRDIREVLRDKLGSQYKFLADELGPAIEEVIRQERQENESRLEEVRRAGIEANVVSAFDRLARETKGESRKLEAQMTRLSEEIPIGTMPVDRYLKVLYNQAKEESAVRSRQETNKRINRNAADVPSRLHSTASGSRSEVPQGKMKLDKAIEWAASEVEKKGR